MRNVINQTIIAGRVYDHDLSLKVSGPNSKNPNTEFINGTLSVATDDNCTNVIPVHFSYVTATTKNGAPNATFTALKGILEGKVKSVMADGKENAATIKIDSALALNEFYTDRNGQEELVSAKRNEGGFVHLNETLSADENQRNTFKCDMVITSVIHVEADEEKNLPEKAIVKGVIFDFKKSILPVEFTALNPGAINYYLGLDVSATNPVFTQVWGQQVSQTVVTKIVEESAFGQDYVREVTNTRKDFVITGGKREPWEWDVEGSITAAELKEAIAKREVYLADIKKRQDEYKASKAATPAMAVNSQDTFNF